MQPSRNTEVDVIRSVTLLGICIVNIPFLALPPEAQLAPPTETIDRIAGFAVEWLFQGKFFLLFSFLFGWGIGVQQRAAERKGTSFAKPYLRRLMGLALLGALHATFVFTGDILLLYAVLGLLILPFSGLFPHKLVRLALYMIPVAAVSFFGLGIILGEEPVALGSASGLAGGFMDATVQRLADWPGVGFFVALFNGPLAFGAFALGIAAEMTGFLKPGNATYGRLKAALPWLLPLGLALNALYAAAMGGLLPPPPSLLPILSLTLMSIGAPMLAAVWLVLAVEAARRWAIPNGFLIAGRNSLTAYVSQGIIAGFVFGGYGLGLFGTLGQAGLLLTAILIWAATALLAALWDKVSARGPLEIVLRLITRGSAA